MKFTYRQRLSRDARTIRNYRRDSHRHSGADWFEVTLWVGVAAVCVVLISLLILK